MSSSASSAFDARSEGGSFSVIPRWIADAAISAHAVRVYLGLMAYADEKGSCFPKQETLAKRCCCSVDTVARALKELTAIGAVRIVQRRQPGSKTQQPNVYLVYQSKPDARRSAKIGSDSDPQKRVKADPQKPGRELDPEDQLDPRDKEGAQAEALPGFEPLTAKGLQQLWNDGRGTLPACEVLNAARRRQAEARLREVRAFLKDASGGDERAFWAKAIAAIAAHPWNAGDNDRGWRADFDYLVRTGTWVRAKEGGFENRAPQQRGRSAAPKDMRRQIRDANVAHVASQPIYKPPMDDDDDDAAEAEA
jgi:hypothetical protein